MFMRYRQQADDLAHQESELRTLYGERHPRMVQLKDEKAKVNASIQAEVSRVSRTLDNDVRVASTRVASIEATLVG